MKPGYYHRINTTTLAVLDICDYYSEGAGRKDMIITRINVPFDVRGKGYGTALLKKCLEDADIEGVRLYLEIMQGDELGLTYEQLQSWYERHGFKQLGAGGMFLRKPAGESNARSIAVR